MKKKLKKIYIAFIIGTIASIFVSSFTTFFFEPLFNKFENFTYDMRYKWKYSPIVPGADHEKLANWPPDEDVVVCDIDERAMSKYGVYWKWPRSYHGDVAQILSKDGAAVTGFDIIFGEADFGRRETKKIGEVLKKIGVSINSAKRKVVKEQVNYDQRFCDGVKKAGNVVAGMLLSDSSDFEFSTDWLKKSTEEWRLKLNPGSAARLPDSIRNTFKQIKFINGQRILCDKDILDGVFPKLAQSAERIGHVNVVPDADGIHRIIPLFHNFRGYTYPALSLQMILQLFGTSLQNVNIRPGKYIDIGKPLKIWHDSSFALRASYPTVTGRMIERIVKEAKKIKKLPENGSVIISSYLRLFKDERGSVGVEVLSGEIPTEVVREILRFPAERFKKLALDTLVRIGKHTAIKRYDDETFDIVQTDQKGEEIDSWETNDDVVFELLSNIQDALVKKVKPGGSVMIAYDLAIRKVNGIYTSKCPVLRGETIRDLIALRPSDLADLKPGIKLALGKDVKIPIDGNGRYIIAYRGPVKKSVKYVSYYDIREKRIAPHYFQHKSILVGSSAAALFDIVSSPYSSEYPGVEIHATLLSDFLDNVFMKKLDAKKGLLILLFMGVVMGIVSYFLRPLWAALVGLLLMFAHFLFAMTMFEGHLWIEIIRPVLTIFFSYIAVVGYQYATEEKNKKFLHDTFKAYLAPELIDQMYENKQMPALGGEEGVRTAFFTDIQGFSTFSEKLGSPVRLVELLNEYLSVMTDILMAESGTLDKYEGDAIIAFFGAPMPLPDHATRACMAGIRMQKNLALLRKKWASEGDKWPEIVHEMRMRIGINSGPIVTGNMGSSVRMNYTMMGDAVNLAARLESGAKPYGVFIMCSEETLKMTDGSIMARQLDLLRVMGKSEPVAIYEVLCTKDELDEKTAKLIDVFGQAYQAYRKMKWDDAITLFEESLKYELNYGQPGVKTCPSIMMKERCVEYRKNPPIPRGEKWDGVFTATSK